EKSCRTFARQTGRRRRRRSESQRRDAVAGGNRFGQPDSHHACPMPTPESSPAVTLSPHEAFALACKAGPLVVRATHHPTGATQAHTVNAPFAFLGRSPVAGVRLDDPSVSQCHAYLQLVEGVPYC